MSACSDSPTAAALTRSGRRSATPSPARLRAWAVAGAGWAVGVSATYVAIAVVAAKNAVARR